MQHTHTVVPPKKAGNPSLPPEASFGERISTNYSSFPQNGADEDTNTINLRWWVDD
jgi:hypothetical protein